MRIPILAAISAVALAACAPGAGEPVGPSADAPAASTAPTASPTPIGGMVLTSADFADGGDLPEWAVSNTFPAQCNGGNLNPQLSWEGAPEGTKSFAITVTDESANGFVHWVHANIPADVTSVARGESASMPGLEGRNFASSDGYVGPCPPGPNHRYKFTVWALDEELTLDKELNFYVFVGESKDHVLERASIQGMYSGPGD